MNILVKVRNEILDEGLRPYTSLGQLPEHLLKDTFVAFQPDEIDLEEMNMIIVSQIGEIFLVYSTDFEFLQKDGR